LSSICFFFNLNQNTLNFEKNKIVTWLRVLFQRSQFIVINVTQKKKKENLKIFIFIKQYNNTIVIHVLLVNTKCNIIYFSQHLCFWIVKENIDNPTTAKLGWFMVINATFNNISVNYIVAVSFIGGGNWSSWRKPPTCRNLIK
jgi:hypothetical protein